MNPLLVNDDIEKEVHSIMSSSQQSSRPSLRWRVVDITVTVVIGVACGVVFWGYDFLSSPLSGFLNGVIPGLGALGWGMWNLAAPLAGLIVRKPGAALLAQIIGSAVELTLGNQWGAGGSLVAGSLQGLCAELAFLVFAYRVWNLGTAILSGSLACLCGFVYMWFTSMQGMEFFSTYVLVTLVVGVLSGAVIAGALMWVVQRQIAKTGVLSQFRSGRVSAGK